MNASRIRSNQNHDLVRLGLGTLRPPDYIWPDALFCAARGRLKKKTLALDRD